VAEEGTHVYDAKRHIFMPAAGGDLRAKKGYQDSVGIAPPAQTEFAWLKGARLNIPRFLFSGRRISERWSG